MLTNWTQHGIFPLQDHDPDRDVGRKQMLVGARVKKLGDPEQGDTGEDLEAVIADVNGHPTIGDVHPWVHWQTEDPGVRPMGSWAQAFAGVITTSDTGTSANAAGPLAMRPVFDSSFKADTRYTEIPAAIPPEFGQPAAGTAVIVLGGTDDDNPAVVAIPVDPRLFAPHTEGPAEGGSLVCDFQPEGEISQVRRARLQTLTRVVPFSRDEATLAWNCALTGVDKVRSGLVWAPMDGTASGPTTGPGIPGGSYSGPGDVVPSDGRSSSPAGDPRFIGPRPGGGGGGAGGGGPLPGEFTAKQSDGFGSAYMDRTYGGPFHAGHADDKHRQDVDLDGNPINSGHISTEAYFYRNQSEDGALLFEGIFPRPSRFPLKSFVHLDWDAAIDKWRWWAEVPQLSPSSGGPTTGGGNGGGRPPGPSTPGPGGPSTPGPGQPTTGTPGAPGGRPGRPGSGGSGPTTGGPTTGVPTTGGPGTGGPSTGRPGGVTGGPATGQPTRGGSGGGPTTGGGGIATGGQPTTGGGGPTTGGGGGTSGDPPITWEDPPPLLEEPIAPALLDPRLWGSTGIPIDPPSPYGTRADAVFVTGQQIEPGVSEFEVFNPLFTSFAGIGLRPQLQLRGAPNLLRNPEAPAELFELDEEWRPHVLKMHAWGKQTDEGWDYDTRPFQGRTRGGIVEGGLLLAPPDFDPEDYLLEDMKPGADVGAATRHMFMLAPGIELAFGEPSTTTVSKPRAVTLSRSTAGEKPFVLAQSDPAGTTVPMMSASVSDAGVPSVVFAGTGAVTVPVGTAAQQPTGIVGMIRVNTDGAADELEVFDSQSGTWISTAVAGGGSGETNTLASPTAGTSLVLPKTGAQLNLRGIAAGDPTMTVASNATDITLAVDPTAIDIADLTGTALPAQYPAALLADGTRALTAALPAGGNLITGLADPVSAQDAATRAYVLAQIATVGASGEANTLATPTAAASLVLPKVGTALNVRGLAAADSAIVVTEDTDDVTVGFDPSAVNIADLTGTATVAQYPGAVLTDGTRALAANLPAGGNRVTGLANPAAPQDAATRAYVDTATAAVALTTPTANASLLLGGLAVRGIRAATTSITVAESGNNIAVGFDPAAVAVSALSGAATTAQYPNAILRDGSRSMTGKLSMGGSRISEVADPENPQDVATRAWVLALIDAL